MKSSSAEYPSWTITGSDDKFTIFSNIVVNSNPTQSLILTALRYVIRVKEIMPRRVCVSVFILSVYSLSARR